MRNQFKVFLLVLTIFLTAPTAWRATEWHKMGFKVEPILDFLEHHVPVLVLFAVFFSLLAFVDGVSVRKGVKKGVG